MEAFMAIGTRIGPFGDTPKSIQIQLPLKGRQLGMTEISRKNIRNEAVGVSDRKGVAFGKPSNDGWVFLCEHVHELSWEGIGMSGGGCGWR